MWIKRTDGQKSSSFTFVVIGFTIVSIWLLLSIFTNIHGVEIREFSGTDAMAFLSPLLAYAWGRKWQEGQVSTSAGEVVTEAQTLDPKGGAVAGNKVLTDPEEDERLVENGD